MENDKGNLFTVPSTGEVIKIFPRSMTSEMMLATDASPPPKPPVVTVNLAGIVTQERNAADPHYIKAYENWDNMLQFDVMKRLMRMIAIEQDLTDERKARVTRLREALEGLEPLPKSDAVLWFFKVAIGQDSDMQAIARACGKLADPQEERISEKQEKF